MSPLSSQARDVEGEVCHDNPAFISGPEDDVPDLSPPHSTSTDPPSVACPKTPPPSREAGREGGEVGQDNPAFISGPEDDASSPSPPTQQHEPPSVVAKDLKETEVERKTEAGDGKKDEVQPQIRNQIVAAVLTAFTHVLLGCIVGLPGVTLPSLTDPDTEDLFLHPTQAALFGSLLHLGAIVGSIVGGFGNTYLGQRVTLLLTMPCSLVLWVSLSFTPSVWVLQVLRVLQGIAMGLVGAASGNYVVEATHSSLRGRLTGLTDVGRQTGFLLVYVVGSLDLTWREVMVVCGCITTIPPFLGLLFMPDSPRWLVTMGREEEARKALVFFRGSHYDTEAELKAIVLQNQQATKNNVQVMDQLRQMTEPSVWRRMVFLCFLMVIVQFTGNIPTATYIVPIFEAVNTGINPYASAVLVGSLRVLGTIAFMMVVDHLGRRKITIIPCLTCAATLLVLGVCFLLQNIGQDVTNIGWLPLTSLLLFSSFVSAAQAATSLLRPELLPTSVRSVGAAICYIFFFLGMYAATQTFPLMLGVIGEHGAFWTYSCCCIVMAVVVAVVLPETRGLSLEQIDDLYRQKTQTKKKVKHETHNSWFHLNS